MKVAIIGSRNLFFDDFKKYIPDNTTKIVSGGAKDIDQCARTFAIKEGIKLTEFLPKYELYGRTAPLKRNIEIINYSDIVIAFWDGKSRGTKFVIDNCKKMNKEFRVFITPLA